jgi:hypothetical protein
VKSKMIIEEFARFGVLFVNLVQFNPTKKAPLVFSVEIVIHTCTFWD